MKFVTLLCLAAFAMVLVPPNTAYAASKAARYLLKQQSVQGCVSASGSFAQDSVFEGDLTGDGRADLIIDHRGLKCSDGGISGFCGAQACSVLIYVRNSAGLLVQKSDQLSIGFDVGRGKRPAISLMGHGARPYTLRWDGRSFSN